MKHQLVDDVAARKFLLGELTPEEQGEVEEQGFLDCDTFAQIQAAEDDLIDEFLSGDLSPDAKERFEKHFLSRPGRFGDVKVAQALRKYISQNAAPSPIPAKVVSEAARNSFVVSWLKNRSSTARLFLVGAVLLISVAGILLVARMLRQQRRATPIQAHQENVRSPAELGNKPSQSSVESANSQGKNSNQTKRALPPKQPTVLASSFLLIPGGPVRGEGKATNVKLSANGIARFELPLIEESSYRSYQATLQHDDGRVIRAWTNLRPRILESGRAIQISVAATLLERGEKYRVLLRGVSTGGKLTEINSYYFQVVN